MLNNQQLALEYLQQFLNAYTQPMAVLKAMVDGLRDHGNSRSTFNRHGDWEVENDGYVDIEQTNYDWLDKNLHNITAPFDAFEALVKELDEGVQSPLEKLLKNPDFEYLFESSEWAAANTPEGTIEDLWNAADAPGKVQGRGWEYEDGEYNQYEAFYDAGGHSTELDVALPYIYKRWSSALEAIDAAKQAYEKGLKAMSKTHPLVKAAQRKGFRVKAESGGYQQGEFEAQAGLKEAVRTGRFDTITEI